MNAGYVIAGMIAGIILGGIEGSFLLGLIGGGFAGMILGRLGGIDQRISDLEWRSRVAERGAGEREERAPPEPEPEPKSVPGWQRPGPAPQQPEPWMAEALVPEPGAAEAPADTGPVPEPEPVPSPWEQTLGPSLAERAWRKAMEWFSTGNVPVKIGVIVTFIGVSFLLKYAIDHELIRFPIELRLLLVAAAGLALTVIGWRLRDDNRVYALSLQGGGAGIMFLTIFAAFRVWALLPPSLAFFLLVVTAAGTGALAVLQNSRTLAIFGVTGGFLAPILASTGQGSHVVLFSYYLVLNAAILGIAWFRAWRELNLLGFAFTFIIGGYWGFQYYMPEYWPSTQPFLVLYFLFYNAIAMLYAVRQPPGKAGIVDGTLVFGTPVIASALQAAMLGDTEYGLAISADSVAVFYALVAFSLFRYKGGYLRLLTESFIALAVVFATLAIPLALDARWTAASWALEGAALVWVGTRQGRQLAKAAGAVLIFASGLAFLDHGWQTLQGLPVLNGNVLGGALIAISALFASRRLEKIDDPDFESMLRLMFAALFAWGLLWWLGTGFFEVVERAPEHNEGHVYLAFLALSAGLAAWLGGKRDWKLLRLSSLLFLPFLLLLTLYQYIGYEHFLRDYGWLAWPLAWAMQVWLLRAADRHRDGLAAAWHFGSLLLLTTVLALEASWWVDRVASTAWAGAAATGVTGAVALLVWRFGKRPAWPVPAHPLIYLNASLVLVAVQVVVLTLISLDKPGNPDPLPYIPVLNPYDLAMLFAVLTSVLSLGMIRASDGEFEYLQPYRIMLAVAFFLLTTTALVRGVHYYANVPWDGEALFDSVIVQTSLSIYWGLLGFAGMVFGARGGRRGVWMIGAGFMALVVIKLFLVDLGNTGTVERIVSFIGIGALLLVVGYFAPAPPREVESDLESES